MNIFERCTGCQDYQCQAIRGVLIGKTMTSVEVSNDLSTGACRTKKYTSYLRSIGLYTNAGTPAPRIHIGLNYNGVSDRA